MALAVRPLDTVEERFWFGASAPHVLKAELPANASVLFTTLFDATLQPAGVREGTKSILDQERLPWARAPNHVRGAEVSFIIHPVYIWFGTNPATTY